MDYLKIRWNNSWVIFNGTRITGYLCSWNEPLIIRSNKAEDMEKVHKILDSYKLIYIFTRFQYIRDMNTLGFSNTKSDPF